MLVNTRNTTIIIAWWRFNSISPCFIHFQIHKSITELKIWKMFSINSIIYFLKSFCVYGSFARKYLSLCSRCTKRPEEDVRSPTPQHGCWELNLWKSSKLLSVSKPTTNYLAIVNFVFSSEKISCSPGWPCHTRKTCDFWSSCLFLLCTCVQACITLYGLLELGTKPRASYMIGKNSTNWSKIQSC